MTSADDDMLPEDAESARISAVFDWFYILKFKDVVEEFKRRRIILACVAAAPILLAAIYLFIATPTYEADIVVVPNLQSSSPTTGSVLSSLGVSSLLGKGYTSTPDFSNFQTLITSEAVARKVIKAHPEFLQLAFGAEWNPVTKTWHPRFSIIRIVNLMFGRETWSPPDSYRLSQYIDLNVELTQLTADPIFDISFNHSNRAFAVNFIAALESAADDILKRDQLQMLNAQAEHLEELLQRTNIVDYRQALVAQLAQVQSQIATIAESVPYGARLLQPAYVSPLPTYPNVLLVFVGAVLIGFVAAFVWLIYQTIRIKRRAI